MRKQEHSEYKVWMGMKQRCLNPKSKSYVNYGGRGIMVCERWLDFDAFCSDMGPRAKGLTLERINNDGNYEPTNCKWGSPLEQSRNRRKFKNAWIETPGGRAPQATSKAGKILNDVKNGRLFREIAEEYKVTIAYISRLRAKAGMPRRIDPIVIG